MYTFEIAEKRGIADDDLSEIIVHSNYDDDTVRYEWSKPTAHYAFASSPFLEDNSAPNVEHLGLAIVGYYPKADVYLLKRRALEDMSNKSFPMRETS